MNEKTLILVCVTVSLLGISLMYLSNKLFQPPIIKISDVNENMKAVLIEGTLIDKKMSESGTYFMKIEDDTGSIDIIVFKNSIKNSDELQIGQKVIVQGSPEMYKDSLELVANKITQIRP